MSEWIEWPTKERVIPQGKLVDIKLRSGEVKYNQEANCTVWHTVMRPSDLDVVAYRLAA